MKTFVIALVGVLCMGCSQTNITDLVKALGENPRGGCGIINAGPYGGGTIAIGSPDVSVSVSASGCEIVGSNVSKITVPTGSIQVLPPK